MRFLLASHSFPRDNRGGPLAPGSYSLNDDTPDLSTLANRLLRWLGLAIAAFLLEGIAWTISQQLAPENALEILFCGTLAIASTVCVFAPTRWLRHPGIAGPVAERPILVRAILAVGSLLMWVITVGMCMEQ